MSRQSASADLSTACKQALVILLEGGGAIRETNCWRGLRGEQIHLLTVESLYERYLVAIVVESRHRKRHTVRLTYVGELAASEIQRRFTYGHAPPNGHHAISEKAARFIVEVVS